MLIGILRYFLILGQFREMTERIQQDLDLKPPRIRSPITLFLRKSNLNETYIQNLFSWKPNLRRKYFILSFGMYSCIFGKVIKTRRTINTIRAVRTMKTKTHCIKYTVVSVT